jgi:hypothetical protein
MNGLPKVWRSDLQLVLEMPRQGVIITLETGTSSLRKMFSRRCWRNNGGWSKSSETLRCCLWVG